MATTARGNALTEAQRVAQLAIRATAIRELLGIWPALDTNNLRRSWPAVEAALLAVLATREPQSAAIASAYYRQFRVAEGVAGASPAVPVGLTDEAIAAARTSLQVTGPATIARLTTLHRRDASRVALVRVAGALGRHVLNGGRQTVLEAVKRDPRARGWRRRTSGKPCSFCRMLAGRGGVYRADTADFQAHDHCACAAEPAYR